MARQNISVGTVANDGTGDPLRSAFIKINQNFVELYTPNTVFENIQLTGRYSLGSNVSFAKAEYTDPTVVKDEIAPGIVFTRPYGYGAGIYNIAVESDWNPETSPANTEWNLDGWNNLDNVKQREYRPFRTALQNRIGQNIVGAELVMHDLTNDQYYTFKFTEWAQGAGHTGAFAYTRRLINTSSNIGVIFADGSFQVSASEKQYDIPQVNVHDGYHTLELDDRGKHIYGFNNTVFVPNNVEVNFPIGTVIKVVAGLDDTTIRATIPTVGSAATIYDCKTGNTGIWIVPSRSLATLLKVEENIWYLESNNIIQE
jgi:hypothetical protein